MARELAGAHRSRECRHRQPIRRVPSLAVANGSRVEKLVQCAGLGNTPAGLCCRGGSMPRVRARATALMLRSRAAQARSCKTHYFECDARLSKHEGASVARPHPSRHAHGRSRLPRAFGTRVPQDEDDGSIRAAGYGRPPRAAKSWATSASRAIALAMSALPPSASPFLIFAMPRPKSGSAHSGSSRNAAS